MRKLDDTQKTKKLLVREMGDFIWDGFCDPAGVGVSMRDILDGASIVGVHLNEKQKEDFVTHMYDVDAETYTAEDEEVRDVIADATDCEDYEKMFSWLEFVVGDVLAPVMISEWRGEFSEEF